MTAFILISSGAKDVGRGGLHLLGARAQTLARVIRLAVVDSRDTSCHVSLFRRYPDGMTHLIRLPARLRQR